MQGKTGKNCCKNVYAKFLHINTVYCAIFFTDTVYLFTAVQQSFNATFLKTSTITLMG